MKTSHLYKPTPIKPADSPGPAPAEPARVSDVFEVLGANLWFLVLFPCLTAAASAIVAFLVMPPEYESAAAIIPLESGPRADSVLADLLEPLPLTLDVARRDESTGIMAFLNSNLLAARLIDKHDLLPVLYPEMWDEEGDARRIPDDEAPTVVTAVQEDKLDEVFSAEYDEDAGLIELRWSGADPGLCARMLENVLAELEIYLREDYVSEASRNRAFLESQTERAAAEVALWENRLPGPKYGASTITRELEAAQAVYVELRRRLALARVAEAERSPDFKVLDPAFVPEIWDKLPRILACALVAFSALALALTLVFARRLVNEARGRGASRSDGE